MAWAWALAGGHIGDQSDVVCVDMRSWEGSEHNFCLCEAVGEADGTRPVVCQRAQGEYFAACLQFDAPDGHHDATRG